ncbi:MAG: polysaccharide ABC transporter ATP-binding protein [Nitrospirales bacterium]
MEDPVIQVESLGKSFRIPKRRGGNRAIFSGGLRNFIHQGKEWARGGFSIGLKNTEEFWALKDVSFEVRRGEAIGIIGRNGAGKSTLLKILSRISEPTQGQAVIQGRVGSLLQVGAGFHNELTGRENVYLNGAILGMRNLEIQERFDEIVEFSEIGRFLDTPIKHYSSGMRIRLGFSVAINLDPEILLLDEVFAVGDAAFRQKCLDRLVNEVLHGRTIIFVSHSMEQVKSLVSRCIVLDGGRITFDGDPQIGVEQYLKIAALQRTLLEFPLQPDRPGQLDRCYLMDEDGKPTEATPFTRPARIRVEFSIRQPNVEGRLGVVVAFCNESGQFLTVVSSDDMPGHPDFSRVGRYYFDAVLPELTLNPSNLVVRPALSLNGKAIHNHPRAGQGLGVSLIDPESDLSERKNIGRRSSLLVVQPLGEWGFLSEDLKIPEMNIHLENTSIPLYS